jgi:hypothetical protein
MSFMFSCAGGDASPFVIPGSALAHGPGMTERGFFRFRQRIFRVLRPFRKNTRRERPDSSAEIQRALTSPRR